MREHIKFFGKSWREHSKRAMTDDSLTALLYGIAARITVQLRKLSENGTTEEAIDAVESSGTAFLGEVLSRGEDLGLKADPAIVTQAVIRVRPKGQKIA